MEGLYFRRNNNLHSSMQNLPRCQPRASLLTALMALAAMSCQRHQDVGQLRLEDGRIIRDILDSTGTSVLLIVEPPDCVSCETTLYEWQEWARGPGRTMRVILTRTPTPAERNAIILSRQRVHGILHTPSTDLAPSAFLFHGVHLIESARFRREMLALIGSSSR